MSHTPHILASVFLCGLWLPIWILIAATYRPSWHCAFCGFTDEDKYLANPGLRETERHQQQQLYNHQQLDANNEDLTFFQQHKQLLAIMAVLVMALSVLGGFNYLYETQQRQQKITSTGASPSKKVLTDAEKVYTAAAISYLSELKQENEALAYSMTAVGSGDKSLDQLKQLVLAAKNKETRAFKKYKLAAVPNSFQSHDRDLTNSHAILIKAFDEYLKYWTRRRISHIELGTKTHKEALAVAKYVTQRLTESLEN